MHTRFPPDISLEKPPLGEAWLEMRWSLKQVGATPGFLQDVDFPFALGTFYSIVKDRYPERKDLEAAQAPLEMLPHVVRHQFWSAKEAWPVLQLGPGVASLNFTKPYTWASFLAEALYLRSALLTAYSSALPDVDLVVLRYLNAEPFEHATKDILQFLAMKLNTTISLPPQVPGQFASKAFPTSATVRLSYDLSAPKGTGTLSLTTGARPLSFEPGVPSDPVSVAIWQLEVASGGVDAPSLSSDEPFASWLNQAHSALHEWFFSFIDGELRRAYSRDES